MFFLKYLIELFLTYIWTSLLFIYPKPKLTQSQRWGDGEVEKRGEGEKEGGNSYLIWLIDLVKFNNN